MFGAIGMIVTLLTTQAAENMLDIADVPAAVMNYAVPAVLFDWGAPDDPVGHRLHEKGAKMGELEAALSWASFDDLDLHVVDPNGERVCWTHVVSRSGGALDVDENADNTEHPVYTREPVEHIVWPFGAAPSGTYKVYAYYFRCHGDKNPASYQVRLTFRGDLASSVKVSRGALKQTLDPRTSLPEATALYSGSVDFVRVPFRATTTPELAYMGTKYDVNRLEAQHVATFEIPARQPHSFWQNWLTEAHYKSRDWRDYSPSETALLVFLSALWFAAVALSFGLATGWGEHLLLGACKPHTASLVRKTFLVGAGCGGGAQLAFAASQVIGLPQFQCRLAILAGAGMIYVLAFSRKLSYFPYPVGLLAIIPTAVAGASTLTRLFPDRPGAAMWLGLLMGAIITPPETCRDGKNLLQRMRGLLPNGRRKHPRQRTRRREPDRTQIPPAVWPRTLPSRQVWQPEPRAVSRRFLTVNNILRRKYIPRTRSPKRDL